MNNANMDHIAVSGKKYAIELLNPLEGISWGIKAASLFGPALGKAVAGIDFDRLQGIDLAKMDLAEVGDKARGLLVAALSACGEVDDAKATNMLTAAIKRCYTPQGEGLSNEATFNAYFREHPGDLYPLGVMALFRLVRDFFPSPPVTAIAALAKKTGRKTGQESPSPKDGKPAPSPVG